MVFGVDTTGLTTIGQVIDAINNNAGNSGPTANRVVARLAQYGNGIELVNDNPASTDTLSVKATFGSNVAQDLGLIPAGQTTSAVTSSSTAAAATLSFASPFQNNSSISVSATNRGTSMNGATILFQTGAVGNTATANYNSGTNQLVVTINPASTQANTVIAAINSTGVFSASLNTSGGSNNGTGLVGTTGTVGTLAGGTAEQLKGKDSNPLEVSGIFNSLIRLRDAIKNSDNVAIERAVNLLDQDFDRINASRADIGARGQQIQSLQIQLDDQNVQIKATLSQDEDIDIVQAYSELASRQAAYQASLQLAARFYQQSLLNYL
ncbi:MAG: flagellin [Pirellulales bacterium]